MDELITRKNNPPPDYYNHNIKFRQNFFGNKNTIWSPQEINSSGKLKYNADRGYSKNRGTTALTQQHIIDHFYNTPFKEKDHIRGSIGVVAPVIDGRLLWYCIDADDKERSKKLRSNLIPVYEKYGINYLIELGGDDLERMHLWTRTDDSPERVKDFVTRIFAEADCDPVIEFDEIFGINKPNNIIRVPLGTHLKRMRKFPLEVNGDSVTDPIEFMKIWNNMVPLTKEKIDDCHTKFIVPAKKKVLNSVFLENKKKTQFLYKPLNLSMPDCGAPSYLHPVVKNCQAINQVLKDVTDDQMIEKKGGVHHSTGLFLRGIALWADVIQSNRSAVPRTTEGVDWWETIAEEYRKRGHEEHNWRSASYKSAREAPAKQFPACKTWEATYDYCDGCIFKGSIQSPREILYAKPLKPHLGERIELSTFEDIRTKTFPAFKERVKYNLENELNENMLLCSTMGSGKSTMANALAAELVKERNCNVLIAVPTGKLAIEHQKRLKSHGVDAFILMSHKNIFNEELKINNFECPEYDKIQHKLNVGVSSSAVKNELCNNCAYRSDCYYPTQYKDVHEAKHKIVIIQHAHFGVPEIMNELLKNKKFDVLIVDESFIKNIFTIIIPKEEELKSLELIGKTIPWVEKLVSWLKGETTHTTKIDPTEENLEFIRKIFINSGITDWRVPNFIIYYNQGRLVNPATGGIEIVHELPKIGIKIFTDATPPVDLLKRLTGMKSITTYGDKEVIDHRKIHPGNRIIQILDATGSVTSLRNEDTFNALMMKIGDLIENDYENKKILITTFKENFPRITNFFLNNRLTEDGREQFPNVLKWVTLSPISRGINDFEDFDVQFLLAGLHFNGRDYYNEAYKFKATTNHHLKKNGERLEKNYFKEVDGNSSIDTYEIPSKRIEPRGAHAYIHEYEDLQLRVPSDPWFKMIYDYNVNSTQQAIRLRFKEDKPRHIYIINNFFMDKLLITESTTMEIFIK